MSTTREEAVVTICAAHGRDRLRLMDIALDVQCRFGGIDDPAFDGGTFDASPRAKTLGFTVA